MMKCIHIVPSITEEASGPSYSVVRLCESLVGQGQLVTMAALDLKPLLSPPTFYRPFTLGLGPLRLGRSPAMARWLNAQVATGEPLLIHNHGMWQMNSVYPAWACQKGNVKIMQSPRGALSEWAMKNGSSAKKLFWPLLQKPALDKVYCFHATSESEYKDIRRMGFNQPIAIIPNGIDLPPIYKKTDSEMRTLLFLSRIHPKKGLDMLLSAWGAIQSSFPDWQLRIVGTDNGGYLEKVKILAAELGLKRVIFSGPLYGFEKWQAYGEADLFVLPTYSENFGLAAAEALASGTPAIVTFGAPWSGLLKERAGDWIEIGLDPLVVALRSMLSRSPEELSAMGQRGRNWMERDFSWEDIGRRMIGVYEWISNNGPQPPSCVKFD